MKRTFILPLIAAGVLSLSSGQAGTAPADCPISREFITTLEFLRDRKELNLEEKAARELATRVAGGCIGSAQRFVRITVLLSRAGLGAKEALQAGLRFSAQSDVSTEAFSEVFQKAFLTEYLDLDLRAALELALSLSAEFSGDVALARGDFGKLVEFCLSEKQLNLPRPECANFAARISRLGADRKSGVAEEFRRAFDFIRSEKGPGLPTYQALKLSEELVAAGPGSPENFLLAYRYASSRSGLAMNAQESLAFARKMSAGQGSTPLKQQ